MVPSDDTRRGGVYIKRVDGVKLPQRACMLLVGRDANFREALSATYVAGPIQNRE